MLTGTIKVLNNEVSYTLTADVFNQTKIRCTCVGFKVPTGNFDIDLEFRGESVQWDALGTHVMVADNNTNQDASPRMSFLIIRAIQNAVKKKFTPEMVERTRAKQLGEQLSIARRKLEDAQRDVDRLKAALGDV